MAEMCTNSFPHGSKAWATFAIVFRMLKKLNRHDAVEARGLKFLIHNITSDNLQVLESFRYSPRVNILFLRVRI
jgi:hypothetical protein